ncbi:MAG: ATP-binding protein [Lawsonibacter sp.]|jgi:two-component system phosphate regulon sensor histidine kinase PhoR
MTAKIFRNSMAVGICVFLLSVALFMGVLYQYFGDKLTSELENEAFLVARGVESLGMDYLEGLRYSSRITWIAQDGTVLYDNVADPATMENHADREEIREALLGSQGTARRDSTTLSEKTFYVARRLEDGTVIRLASAQRTVVVLLLSMVQPLLVILVITLLLAAVLASRMSKRMVQPILNLDLEHPEECDTYDELTPLLTRIRRQNDTIGEQMDLLRQRQQEFKALTENMSEGFVLLDRKGHILSHNNGVLRLLDTVEPAEEANILALDRSDVFRTSVEQVLKGNRNQCRLERSGRCVQLLADPVFRGGEVAGAVLVLVDVTEREQGEKMRREFTANVSHELKTPLTAISGMAEIMSNGMVKPEDIQSFAEDIYKESQRLIALVEDILHLSRLDEGGSTLQREDVDLLEVARKTVQRMQPLAKQANVTLAVAGTPFVVHGVSSVLEEMIYNLCDNAVKYNRPGGAVTLSVCPGEHGGEVTVADTGIGIPIQDQERVFERFYRVDKSHSKEIGGTGLGLSIVKHGAALHDAQVELSSTPGEGTTIRLYFPR